MRGAASRVRGMGEGGGGGRGEEERGVALLLLLPAGSSDGGGVVRGAGEAAWSGGCSGRSIAMGGGRHLTRRE